MKQLSFNQKVFVLLSGQITSFKLLSLLYFTSILLRNVNANCYLNFFSNSNLFNLSQNKMQQFSLVFK